MINKKQIKALFIDLDGTVYFKGEPISGTQEAIDQLRHHFLLRFLTNTDSKTPQTIVSFLKELGYNISIEEIFNPPVALQYFLSQQKEISAYLLLTEDVQGLFKNIPQPPTITNPKFVVVGDVRGPNLYERLNLAYRYLRKGADFIALQKSPYFISPEGYSIDTGSFVKLLEDLTNKKSLLIGKPSKSFFEIMLNKLDLLPDEILVIGDSLETDILGGHSIGSQTVLVRTGKFTREKLEKSKKQPDLIIKSLAELPSHLL
jgi:HAD superfamily hydrolase (TIGR01458 family)